MSLDLALLAKYVANPRQFPGLYPERRGTR